METTANPEQVEALKKCIEDHIAVFKAKGRRNKKGAIIVQTFIIVLSATTTIFIGWKIPPEDKYIRDTLINFALITSAVTTGLNMLYNFFDYKELWAQYKIAANELEAILAELKYLEKSNIERKDLDRIFGNYSSVCKNTNSAYKQIRISKDTTTDS